MKGEKQEPFAFGVLCGSIGTMFGLFWHFLLISGSVLSSSLEGLNTSHMMAFFLGLLIASPFFVAFWIFFSSSLLHLCLRLVRGGNNGFEGSFRVVSYSQATQIFGIIPFVGGLIAWVWNMIIQIIGFKEIHGTSYARVIIAYLIPLFFIIISISLVIVIFFIGHKSY